MSLYTNTEERPLIMRAKSALDCASISESVCVCRYHTPATGLTTAVSVLTKFHSVSPLLQQFHKILSIPANAIKT